MLGLGKIKLFRVLGIQIEAHWSLLLALLLFASSSSLLLAVLIFTSVLIHELGHSVVARQLGVPIAGIELHFFGGVAKMTRLPETPRDEILIAAAGPLTSLLLAVSGWAVWGLLGQPLLLQLAGINLSLAIFNMLPALPMDGGRIFRAALQTRLGGLRATRIAARVARVLAVGLAVLGIVYGAFFLPVLALMLWFMAGQELAFAEMRYGRPEPQAEVMGQPGAALAYQRAVNDLLAQIANRQTSRHGDARQVVMRDSQGRVIIVEEGAYRW